MKWAITCFEHVLPYYGREPDQVLQEAMTFAVGWSRGRCSTGDLMKASRKVHTFAKTIHDPVACAVARSIGQGVATSHMVDHCMGAALYAQKAVFLAGKPVSEEQAWQVEELRRELPDEIVKLVICTMKAKAMDLGLANDA